MPYDPDALFSGRTRATSKNGRPEEIKRLSGLWFSVDDTEQGLNTKVEELFWLTTLLLVGTGKPGRKPRLDFFLMHLLNSTLFIPSLLKIIPTKESKVKLLKTYLPCAIMNILLRGRPRIDAELIMTYTATPSPPTPRTAEVQTDTPVVGDPNDADYVNPWPAILADVVHGRDAHTVKAIRGLYYASQHYGTTPPGSVIGALVDGKETHKGIGKVDGTVFVRAAGVVMDTLGWVTHGQKAGDWDRTALGWDDAWKTDP